MLDGIARRLIDPPLARLAQPLARARISANTMTLAGLACGLACAWLVAAGLPRTALVLLALSRLCDGLDGAIARLGQRSEFGGLLDIVCDFTVYGAVPLGFAFLDPQSNALAAATLLLSFYVNGASFLAYAALAARRGMETQARGVKTLYFTAGLMEGTETIAMFVAMMLWPAQFAPLAWGFAALCIVTAASRVWLASKHFR